MHRALCWIAAAGVGFTRSLGLAVGALIIPALVALLPVLAALNVVGTPWSWTNAWSWVGLILIAAMFTLVGARPIGTLFRRLISEWCGLSIDDGYRRPADEPEPVQLATGYWWNGHSYESNRRDAQLDQQWRRRIGDPAYWRDVRWVVLAAVSVGPICVVPVAALVGAVFAFAHPVATTLVTGLVLIAVAVAASPYTWRVVAPFGGRWLRVSGHDLTERLRQLERQRSDLTATQSAEIRRIERDLHDGAQARLVAVGLSLATAEKLMDTDPGRARALLREARAGTSDSLTELRDLVRGVNPPVLVERGVVEAIRALALDSSVRVRVDATDRIQLEAPLEAAVYFSVAELLANAAKHAPSARVDVHIRRRNATIEVDVVDDGPGGATIVPGNGLDGIRRRVAAFDGTLGLTSPAGGPTLVEIVIPCV